MRVTFVTASADFGGGARVVATYAQQLQKRGHQVTILSRPGHMPSLKNKLGAIVRGRPVPRGIKFPPSHFDNLDGVAYRRISRVRPIAAADVPDGEVVIATWWETAEWVATFPASKGAKVYFIQHYYEEKQEPRMEATWRLPLHKILISEALAKVARERYGAVDASLVPNAVDLDRFHAPPRAKQNIPTVGTVFSHASSKGSDVVFKAFELARKSTPSLRLICFGHRAPSPASLAPEGTEFTVTPAQERIREIYAGCDAWLAGNRLEGFGLPILEAMACRTPVIATPAGAAPELLARGGGFLVPHENPRAMADAISQIVQLSQKQWVEVSDAAFATASGYTWDDAANLFAAALVYATTRAARGGAIL